jgi:hypothetical protein
MTDQLWHAGNTDVLLGPCVFARVWRRGRVMVSTSLALSLRAWDNPA